MLRPTGLFFCFLSIKYPSEYKPKIILQKQAEYFNSFPNIISIYWRFVLLFTPYTIMIKKTNFYLFFSFSANIMTISFFLNILIKKDIRCFMDNFSFNNDMRPNRPDTITVGRVMSVDIPNRFFTVMTDSNPNSAIRFNLADNVRITDFFGRPINLCCLSPGSRVRVRHANFMTMSIPPQTTAFSVRVIG